MTLLTTTFCPCFTTKTEPREHQNKQANLTTFAVVRYVQLCICVHVCAPTLLMKCLIRCLMRDARYCLPQQKEREQEEQQPTIQPFKLSSTAISLKMTYMCGTQDPCHIQDPCLTCQVANDQPRIQDLWKRSDLNMPVPACTVPACLPCVQVSTHTCNSVIPYVPTHMYVQLSLSLLAARLNLLLPGRQAAHTPEP